MITLSAPYHVTWSNPLVRSPTLKGESWILTDPRPGPVPDAQTIAPKVSSSALRIIATRTPSGAICRAVNGSALTMPGPESR